MKGQNVEDRWVTSNCIIRDERREKAPLASLCCRCRAECSLQGEPAGHSLPLIMRQSRGTLTWWAAFSRIRALVSVSQKRTDPSWAELTLRWPSPAWWQKEKPDTRSLWPTSSPEKHNLDNLISALHHNDREEQIRAENEAQITFYPLELEELDLPLLSMSWHLMDQKMNPYNNLQCSYILYNIIQPRTLRVSYRSIGVCLWCT